MLAADVLKEYLVSLGFKLDAAAYDKFQRTLQDTQRRVEATTMGMTRSFVTASGTVVAAIGAITAATAGLLNNLAQADLGYKKYALRMYMGTEAAQRLKIAVDALGESLEDIQWQPEIGQRYKELLEWQKGMGPPAQEYDAQMKKIRDIRQEFTKFRVTMVYGLQMIGYSISKILGKDIGDFDQWLKKTNDWVKEKLPEWSEKVATFMAKVTGWSIRAAKAVGALWSSLSEEVKFGVIGAAILGVFGRIATAIGAAIGLVEDFYSYIRGDNKDTKLAPIWHALLGASKSLQESWQGLKEILDSLFGDSISKWFSLANVFEAIATSLTFVGSAIAVLVQAAADLIDYFRSLEITVKTNQYGIPTGIGVDSGGKPLPFAEGSRSRKAYDKSMEDLAKHRARMEMTPEERAEDDRKRRQALGIDPTYLHIPESLRPKGKSRLGGVVNPNSGSPEADRIAMAMKIIESGGNYNAKEAGGAGPGVGAYQFTGTWGTWSRQYSKAMGLGGGVLPMTPENQDKVATWMIQGYLNKGYNAREIAAIWNEGEEGYRIHGFEHKGVNKYGIPYDVGAHVRKFDKAYKQVGDYQKQQAQAYPVGSSQPVTQNSSVNVGNIIVNAKTDADKHEIAAAVEAKIQGFQQQSKTMAGARANREFQGVVQ